MENKNDNERFYHRLTKKQLYDLWLDAIGYDIKDDRLDQIKEALQETVNLGQFSKFTFIDLMDTLFSLPSNALEDIADGNFSRLYKAYYKHTKFMPEDYYYMSIFLKAIYTDYKSISNIDEYQKMCNDYFLFIKDILSFNDIVIESSLSKANPDLVRLLKSRNINFQYIDENIKGDAPLMAIGEIENHLMVSFLMNIDFYGGDYNLPSNLLNDMIQNIKPFDLVRIAIYMDVNEGSSDLTKELLGRYHLKEKTMFETGKLIGDNSSLKRLKKKN